MTETTVILLLAALPVTATGAFDRDALVALAGPACAWRALVTVTQERGEHDFDGRWIAILRCWPVPVAEILRTEPYEAPRRSAACVPSPWAGWCQDGSRRPGR